ncbi:MAG TPA: PIG-L family deacetylase [Gemmatimonadales bacterium]
MNRRHLAVAGALLALTVASRPIDGQDRGAAALAEAVEGLGVTTRVLVIGAHPDDEDTNLIAFLSRGRHVETAYLSLTRGDGGQNLIGDELGEALGAIRTEELLAARRVDGGRQYFTRAYDFGFSKSAEETYTHWPKDTILGDVVRVVRQFRPHVIVAVFSGTPRDGHGHHQVSGLLAREAYEIAGDTARFPRGEYGVEWTPLKFYRARRGNADGASVRMNAGEYDPVLGRSYAEIAGESRSQHKSQGFGSLERKGPLFTHVLREASRVNAPGDPNVEQSIFDGIDTTLGRFAGAPGVAPAARAQLDSAMVAIAGVQAALDVRDPSTLVVPLGRVRWHVGALCTVAVLCERDVLDGPHWIARNRTGPAHADFARTAPVLMERYGALTTVAAGVEMEAFVDRELAVVGRPVPVRVTVYNHGPRHVSVAPFIQGAHVEPVAAPSATGTGEEPAGPIPPGGSRSTTLWVRFHVPTEPVWLRAPRQGDLFTFDETLAQPPQALHARVAVPPLGQLKGESPLRAVVSANVLFPDVARGGELSGWSPMGSVHTPVVYRYADPVHGEIRRPVAAVPAVSVTLERPLEMLPANSDVERRLRVRLRSADTASRAVTVRLDLPQGLASDSASRTVVLPGYDAQATVSFTVRGRMAPGRDTIRVTAESEGETFATGYQLVDYPHIRPRRLYRPAELVVQAVDVRVPAGLRIAYVPGVSDVVAPALRELGLDVTVIEPAALASTDLSRFTTVVVGPRAYEAHPGVMASRARLLDFARRGGTLVVQYQQNEVQRPGVVPYPMTVARPHDRVTIEEAPVTFVDPSSPLLTGPNRIGAADFEGWVQERSLYMPRTFDERYAAPLEMHDPGEPERRGALLVAPLGEGTYVYTAISFFRQLPAGVPGAARLFVNLLAAGQGTGAP